MVRNNYTTTNQHAGLYLLDYFQCKNKRFQVFGENRGHCTVRHDLWFSQAWLQLLENKGQEWWFLTGPGQLLLISYLAN